jgi:hypothetical protein
MIFNFHQANIRRAFISYTQNKGIQLQSNAIVKIKYIFIDIK